MIELDYAYLADFAKVENGTITAVGASFLRVQGPLPFQRMVAVAGRIRAPKGIESFELSVEFRVPGDEPEIQVSGTVNPATSVHTYRDKVAVLFVVSQPLALSQEGLVEVDIRVNGDLARTLKFDVVSL